MPNLLEVSNALLHHFPDLNTEDGCNMMVAQIVVARDQVTYLAEKLDTLIRGYDEFLKSPQTGAKDEDIAGAQSVKERLEQLRDTANKLEDVAARNAKELIPASSKYLRKTAQQYHRQIVNDLTWVLKTGEEVSQTLEQSQVPIKNRYVLKQELLNPTVREYHTNQSVSNAFNDRVKGIHHRPTPVIDTGISLLEWAKAASRLHICADKKEAKEVLGIKKDGLIRRAFGGHEKYLMMNNVSDKPPERG